MLRDKSIAANTELSQKYSLGYVLFGVANGKVIFQTNAPSGLQFSPKNNMLISIDSEHKKAELTILFFPATTKENYTFQWDQIRMLFNYVENQPMRFQLASYTVNGRKIFPYVEVLDEAKAIFVLGFKDS